MRRSLTLLFAVAGVVFALDQWTKRWATEVLAGREPLPVVGELVRFTYTRNSGVAFGLGAGTNFPFYIFSLLAVVAILALFVRGRVQGLAHEAALALIFGGALGNFVDRVTSGRVVDFIEIGTSGWRFPVFNVADSAVTVGVALFALGWTRRPHGAPATAVAPGTEGAGAGAAPEGAADAGAHGAGATHGGAAGPLSGGGAGDALA